MSNDLAMSMEELAAESAELLPARETLCVSKMHHSAGNSLNVTQVDGNTVQNGLINVSLLNGVLDGIGGGIGL
jgi:hypothetical protein